MHSHACYYDWNRQLWHVLQHFSTTTTTATTTLSRTRSQIRVWSKFSCINWPETNSTCLQSRFPNDVSPISHHHHHHHQHHHHHNHNYYHNHYHHHLHIKRYYFANKNYSRPSISNDRISLQLFNSSILLEITPNRAQPSPAWPSPAWPSPAWPSPARRPGPARPHWSSMNLCGLLVQDFYRSDAVPVTQPTVSKHWRENNKSARTKSKERQLQHSQLTISTIERLSGERTEHLNIFPFSAHHSMVFYFRSSVYKGVSDFSVLNYY